MIKQFNFYDIYGYLFPGILLLGLFWLPVGILTQTWPDQDLSKAVFLTVLAYILGHLMRTIGNSVVPSTVLDDKMQSRAPSDLLLDKSNAKLGDDFKARLNDQVKKLFHLDLQVTQEGTGQDKTSSDRRTAFFEARSYLIAKKSAQYAEQFEGLYAMMRSFGCAFLAGAFYLAGWCLAFYRDQSWLSISMRPLFAIGAAGALASALAGLHTPKKKEKKEQAKKKSAEKKLWKNPDSYLAFSMLAALLGSGFWAGVWQPYGFWVHAPQSAASLVFGCIVFELIAAAKCFSAYRFFADLFAQTVWRDFSAYLSFQGTSAQSSGNASEES